MKIILLFSLGLHLVLHLWSGVLYAEIKGGPEAAAHGRFEPVVGTRGMVVSDSREASQWGAEILRQGGNAIDAAVATAFVLAVTRPHYAGLGGGGFLLYCPKPTHSGPARCQFLDYRERAPLKARSDMFIQDGKIRTDLAQSSALASGVPGVTAGLLTALEKLGTLHRKKLLTRAIELARNGFVFTGHAENAAMSRWLQMNEEAQKIFGCRDAQSILKPCAPGTLVTQKDLAHLLEAIARHGKSAFYQGQFAKKLINGVQAAGGIISLEDFESYTSKWREPLVGHAEPWTVISAPPPSSGGIVVMQLLQYAKRAADEGRLKNGIGSTETLHALTHAMSLAFADRAQYLGDPDFNSLPMSQLLASSYLDRRWKTFNPNRMVVPELAGGLDLREGQHTTHFSVIDQEGNAVAITTTLNENYGSGFVPPGTGVVMNNEMDDFSLKSGVPNLFGLVASEANAIEPQKRPLSSMSPTVVQDQKGNNLIVIGAAGGPRIITSVFLSLLNRLQFSLPLLDAVAAPRFHHQWNPQDIFLEEFAFPIEVQTGLKKKGYTLTQAKKVGFVHALERTPNGRVMGAPDPRGEGAAVAE